MPHSILKKSESRPDTTPIPPAVRSREDRNQETALYHAQLLQQRKDLEALVLASTEALLDVPSSLDADPASPSPSDAALVKSLLRPFQPSDYDALIDERNINGQCGYVLCPQNKRKQDTKARYRILHGNGRDSDALKFVLTQSLEMWCSDECGKRAMYIKVQLIEEPAWTRANTSSGDIDLLENKITSDSEPTLIERMTSLGVGVAEDQLVDRLKALALERGNGNAPNRLRGLGEVDVRDKVSATSKVTSPEPLVGGSGSPYDSIEGYTPRYLVKTRKGKENGEEIGEEEEDMLPNI